MNKNQIQNNYRELFRLCVSNYLKPEEDRLPAYQKAQQIILSSVRKLEDYLTTLKVSKISSKSPEIVRIQNQILLFKDFGNTIAWHLIGENETNLRSYFGAGPNHGRLKDKNLKFEFKILHDFQDTPNAFILLCDLTTMINIGDVMIKKVGSPPLTLELKEGEINKKLIKILHNDDALNEFVNSVEPSKRKTTEQHIKRLKDQKKRIDHLNTYLRDDSSRYNEELNTDVMIVKPSKHIEPSYFCDQLNNTYRKLDISGIKTIKIRGGLYALVTKRPENYDDHIHFRHMVYHKINRLNFTSDCMISSVETASESTQNEIAFIQNLEVYRPLEGLGRGGFKPLPACMEKLDEDFAVALLSQEASLYFAIDPQEFLSGLNKYGMSWEAKKLSDIPGEANGAFRVNGKKIIVNSTGILTKNFLERMFRSFHRPSYEIKMIKEMMQRVDKLTDAEIKKYSKSM